MQNGIVFSDLHIFHPGVEEDSVLLKVRNSLQNAEICVMNGDIFDFKRTDLPSIENAIDHASEILVNWVKKFPLCQFHYVLGNQDCLGPFVAKLCEVSKEFNNLTIHEDYFVIGDKLFLHGDAAHSFTTPDAVKNYRINAAPSKPDTISRLLAKIIVNLRLNLTAYIYPSIPKVVSNIEYYINQLDIDLVTIRAVYFGHTHVAFEAYEKNKVLYNNTGTAVNGMEFKVLEFEIQ